MTGARTLVLLVGHCTPDTWALKSAIRGAVGDAEARFINDQESLRDDLDEAVLLLVNRELDGVFPYADGVELIADIAADNAPAMMLVSNHDDAQARAHAAGALEGFGKKQLYDPATRERIAAAVRTHMGT